MAYPLHKKVVLGERAGDKTDSETSSLNLVSLAPTRAESRGLPGGIWADGGATEGTAGF